MFSIFSRKMFFVAAGGLVLGALLLSSYSQYRSYQRVLDINPGKLSFAVPGFVEHHADLEFELAAPERSEAPMVRGADLEQELSQAGLPLGDFPLTPRQWRPFIIHKNGKYLLYNLIDGHGHEKHLLVRSSDDLQKWSKPTSLLQINGYTTFIFDERDWGVPETRPNHLVMVQYKLDEPGIWIARSSDGYKWVDEPGQPSFKALPLHSLDKGWMDGPLDIIDIGYNKDTKEYYALFKMLSGDRLPLQSRTNDPGHGVRIVGIMSSSNLKQWSKPKILLTPKQPYDGVMEFYSATPVPVGNGHIALVRILRDDLAADGGDAKGIGYTTLLASIDGNDWTLSEGVFLDRSRYEGRHDFAHAWITSAVLRDGVWHFVYSAYDTGHKHGERNVGYARMREGRWASYSSKENEIGLLRTRYLKLRAAEKAQIGLYCDGIVTVGVRRFAFSGFQREVVNCNDNLTTTSLTVSPDTAFQIDAKITGGSRLFGVSLVPFEGSQ